MRGALDNFIAPPLVPRFRGHDKPHTEDQGNSGHFLGDDANDEDKRGLRNFHWPRLLRPSCIAIQFQTNTRRRKSCDAQLQICPVLAVTQTV